MDSGAEFDGVQQPQSRCFGLAPGVAFYWMGPIRPTFLARKSRAATKWRWAIHTPVKRARPFGKGDSAKVCAEKGRESTEI
jgi:hypothetical protein